MKWTCDKCKTVVKHWAKECPKCGGALKGGSVVIRKGAMAAHPRWSR